MKILTIILLLADLGLFAGSAYFTFESIREQERRAPLVGAWGIIISLCLGALILWMPALRIAIFCIFLAGAIFAIICLIPAQKTLLLKKGAEAFIVGNPERHDERDVTFARLRSLPPGSDIYRRYYEKHPHREESDAARREKGLLGKLGGIDGQYRPLAAMVHSAFDMPHFLGKFAVSEPEDDKPQNELDPAKATEIVKGLALHLGADMVGICRVNPLWVYSHRGEIHYDNWDEWGKDIDPESLPPFAVVMLTEMDIKSVGSAPHTPSVTESAGKYAKGAYLSTMMARWFAHMGYRGVAENTRNYDIPLPPLAVDAGLGEVGRLGYLMAPKFGARIRIFATLTDMPLAPDKPISIGGDEFCKRCKKCADSCPSRSIPQDDKVIYKGALKWKLDEDSCFEYWSKVGTDCSVCMAVCPFSRPDTMLHNLVRWFVARSVVAQRLFPYIDNFIYGKKWHARSVPKWLDYPK